MQITRRLMCLVMYVGGVAVVSSQSLAAGPPRYTLMWMEKANSFTYSYPAGILNSGLVVGYGARPHEDGYRAALWHRIGSLSLNPFPEDVYAMAYAASEDGIIVGKSEQRPPRGRSVAAIWIRSTTPTAIEDYVVGADSFTSHYLAAINSHHVIAGAGNTPHGGFAAFYIDSDRILHDIGRPSDSVNLNPMAINESNTIVMIISNLQYVAHGFIWSNGAFEPLEDGGRRSEAFDITDAGEVVGMIEEDTGSRHAALWRNGALTDLGQFNGLSTVAIGINNRHQILGFYGPGENGFLWQDNVLYDIETLIKSQSNWVAPLTVSGINDAGQIVGTAVRDWQSNAIILNPVFFDLTAPEPGRAGEINQFSVAGAVPGSTLSLVYGVEAGLFPIPGCAGATVLISRPVVGTSATADTQGSALFEAFIPERAAGSKIRVQVIDANNCQQSQPEVISIESF